MNPLPWGCEGEGRGGEGTGGGGGEQGPNSTKPSSGSGGGLAGRLISENSKFAFVSRWLLYSGNCDCKGQYQPVNSAPVIFKAQE